jgi:hypothetical protein
VTKIGKSITAKEFRPRAADMSADTVDMSADTVDMSADTVD